MSASHPRPLVALVVEDEAIIRFDAADAFRRDEWTVLEANTAEAALATIAEAPILDVLFTDIDLKSATNGWDIADACRARHEDVVVIYTSGHSREGPRKVPNSVFFGKPYDPDRIIKTSRVLADKDKR